MSEFSVQSETRNSNQLRWIGICSLIIVAVIARFIPHPPNFSPVGAVALFSGAMLVDRRLALFVPLVILAITDAFIGFHWLVPVVYGCFLINVLLGRWVGLDRQPLMIGVAALAGSVQFFLLTNLADWWIYDPHTREGFLLNYIEAIPFFQRTLAGDLFFTTVLFGGWNLAERYVHGLRDLRQTSEV